MSSSLQMSMAAHCPLDERTISRHIGQLYQKIKRTWEESSLLTSKWAKRIVSLYTRRPYRKIKRTWQDSSLLTSKLAKSTVSLHMKDPYQKIGILSQEKASKKMLSP